MELAYPPKAIIFDWDNTLVDTWPIIHKALQITFEYMGLQPWSLAEVKQRVGKSMRDSFPDIFGNNWHVAAEKYRNTYRSIHLDCLQPIAGAAEIIKFAADKDIYMAIVSNKLGDTLRREVEHIGWNKFFNSIIGATDAEHDKPHAAPINMALKPGCIEANYDVWFIGDSEIDLETAHAAGILPLLYGRQLLDSELEISCKKYRGWQFHSYYPTHAEFMEMLQQIFADDVGNGKP